ncbi:hypothetical protein GALMADRAFT_62135, partial [Galerina marginata CBS 339.88]
TAMTGNGTTNRQADPLAALPLHELLTQLSPQEVSFFLLLDSQLDKVESFYLAREKEMLARGHTLQLQLKELQDHRKLFHVPAVSSTKVNSQENTVAKRPSGLSSTTSNTSKTRTMGKRRDHEDDDPPNNSNSGDDDYDRPYQAPLSADPDTYLYAKRKLKKAVLEHYRGLEVLHNYRVLNVTGFRKALKKFEKVTRVRSIACCDFYLSFSLSFRSLAFASDKAVRQMMSEMEEMYATAFARGDKKRATRRLRAGNSTKSHHFSAFRSGVYVGLAIPALIEGLLTSTFTQFRDFWMGDQFCSLIFTLSNLYFFVCVYVNDFAPDWQKCGATSAAWPLSFIIATLPLLIRLVQSIKRYADSKLVTHLINGGKYGTGIITYLFYFMWRHRQDTHGTIFAFWCLFSVCYSIYAGAWDLLMDWSVLRLHAKNPLLRPELIYSNHPPMYYFAIITNILIRFIWVIYIPSNGPNMMVRTFIAGFLEMLRRWQWNFYRLENEHLGNMDQYRVTREVPLPYVFNDRTREDDADDDDNRLKVKR